MENQVTAHKPTYMGYKDDDFKTSYAKFFNENMAPIPEYVVKALQQSPFTEGTLPPLSALADMMNPNYADVESGYTLESDGSIRIAILTRMPKVKPYMWDWWFSWHGSHANRYKIWHPKAHKDARWEDGRDDLDSYVGRNSLIEEYIGKSLEKASIRFIQPEKLGINPQSLKDRSQVTMICARVGYRDYPVDFGYLVHQVRAVEEGAEMRSRFFFGGSLIGVRGGGFLGKGLSKLIRLFVSLPEQRAIDLLTHCAEEMNHLAHILPAIYEEFGKNRLEY